jgi:hypothetical protein
VVVVDLTLAAICFLGQCHPALVGDDTPIGEFTLELQTTSWPGYGGDLLVFHEDRHSVWAIHRVIPGQPGQRRTERLRSGRPELRRGITHGCINVTPQVYRALVRCCEGDTLVVKGAPGAR